MQSQNDVFFQQILLHKIYIYMGAYDNSFFVADSLYIINNTLIICQISIQYIYIYTYILW